MELSFVLSALRRRFWIVTLLAGLGALPGLLTDPPVSNEFRSEAELIIRQPTQANSAFSNADSDRYVVSELSVMESAELVNDVAVANNLTLTQVRQAVEIEQLPETNVVRITAIYTDPDIARGIAQAYANEYMATLDTELSDDQEAERLDELIRILQNRLSVLNGRIQEAMQPYLDRQASRPTLSRSRLPMWSTPPL